MSDWSEDEDRIPFEDMLAYIEVGADDEEEIQNDEKKQQPATRESASADKETSTHNEETPIVTPEKAKNIKQVRKTRKEDAFQFMSRTRKAVKWVNRYDVLACEECCKTFAVVGCLSHFSAEEGVDERVQRLSIEMAKQRVRDLICGGFMFDAY
jgi:hypothetical protein